MNETQIEQFRQKLLSLRAQLQRLQESSKEGTELDEAALGQLSRVDAMQARLMAEEAVRGPKRQLGKIEGALRRIEADDYGKCFICGEEIEIPRLSEDPTYTRCIKCIES